MNKSMRAIGAAVLLALAGPASVAAQTISEDFVLQACDGADSQACTAFAAAYIAQATNSGGSPAQKRQAIKSLIARLAMAADTGDRDPAMQARIANALNASIIHYLGQMDADARDPDSQRQQITGLVVDLVDLARAHSGSANINKAVAGAIGTIGTYERVSDFVNADAVRAIAETLDPGQSALATRFPIEDLDTALVIDDPISAN